MNDYNAIGNNITRILEDKISGVCQRGGIGYFPLLDSDAGVYTTKP